MIKKHNLKVRMLQEIIDQIFYNQVPKFYGLVTSKEYRHERWPMYNIAVHWYYKKNLISLPLSSYNQGETDQVLTKTQDK